MKRSYTFRLRPTARQHAALDACLQDHRTLYNAALEERREAWRRCRVNVFYTMQSAQLRDIRTLVPTQSRWSFSSQQATLRRLDRAFAGFFRRAKTGTGTGLPRYKSISRFTSVMWPSDGDGCRWKPEHGQIYLQGIGTVKVSAHRPAEGVVKTIQIKREGRRWFLVLACDNVPARPLPASGASTGLDMGVSVFAATSDGELIANPRHGRMGAAELARAQQVLARKKPGSANRQAAKAVVANRHRKIANQRRDLHHKIARRLVTDYDTIAIEDLKVSNMARSASGTVETPGVSVAQKSGLNHAILDAGWAQFRSILANKAEEAGRRVITVNPRHTSQMHYLCGRRGDRDGLRFWCPHCGIAEHADINAARNILRAGLALQAASVT